MAEFNPMKASFSPGFIVSVLSIIHDTILYAQLVYEVLWSSQEADCEYIFTNCANILQACMPPSRVYTTQ